MSSRGPSFGSERPGVDGIERSRRPGAPGSPSDGRAPRAAAPARRARRSGRQPLATARPASGQDASAPGSLHPGTEAVLLGAMSLLRLVGLLHRSCARSSPSASGTVVPSTPRGTQTRRALTKRMARRRPGDYRAARKGRQTARGIWPTAPGALPPASPGGRRGLSGDSCTDTPWGYGDRAERLARPVGAVLSFAGPRRRDARGRPRQDLRRSRRQRSPAADGRRATPIHRFPEPALVTATHRQSPNAGPIDMDAKQVWRAALGELQVSLSPANFETWLRDTALVAVETTASGSPSRTASPRTGWRPATAR